MFRQALTCNGTDSYDSERGITVLFVQVEVRMREGHAVNIHMFCARRPGILLSTMTALDSLGLDIEQAVISCFNGFAMDVFRAEVCCGQWSPHQYHFC